MRLLEDGTSKRLLEDGTSRRLFEGEGGVSVTPGTAGVACGVQTPALPVSVLPAATGVVAGIAPGAADSAVGSFSADVDGLRGVDLPSALNGAWTVIGWARLDSLRNGCVFQLFDTGTNGYVEVFVESTGAAQLYSNTGNQLIGTVNTNEWFLFAMTSDGSLNGVGYFAGEGDTALTASSALTIVNVSNAPTDLYIGRSATFSEYLDGAMTEVCVYSRCLTPTEVLAEFNAKRTRASTTNLIGQYHLLNNATKLNADVGSSLQTLGAGSWTDVTGPFSETNPKLVFGGGGVTINPAATGVAVGTQAPTIAATNTVSATGVLVGTQAPTMAAPISPAATGVVTGTQAPTLAIAVVITPAATGALVGTQTPASSATVIAAATGVATGTQAPATSAAIFVGTTGSAVGTQAPTLAAAISVSSTGAAVGAQTPVARVTASPSATGVVVGTQAPGIGMSIAPSSTGVATGTWAPSLSVAVLPASTGVSCSAWSPATLARIFASSTGVDVGTWPAQVPVTTLQPGAVGVVVGAWAPSSTANLTPDACGVVVAAWSLAQPLRFRGGFGSGMRPARRSVSRV